MKTKKTRATAGGALRRRAMNRTLQQIAALHARRVSCIPYQSTAEAISAEERIYDQLERVR